MNKAGIEFLTHTWGIYSGCFNHLTGVCGGESEFECWAKTITQRFKAHYPYGFQPTFYPERLLDPVRHKKSAVIGVAFMGDLFGDWMTEGKVIHDPEGNLWSGQGIMESIFRIVERCPQHTFIFLTKAPWNLPLWNPWPDNAWVGASATNSEMAARAQGGLMGVSDNVVKFVSYEPLLEDIGGDYLESIDLVILGGKSGKGKFYPPKEWIDEILHEARRLNIPVFIKDNAGHPVIIREFPKVPVN